MIEYIIQSSNELYHQGGLVLVAIFICSLFAWSLATSSWLYLMKKTAGGFDFAHVVVMSIHQGKVSGAADLCRSYPNIFGNILLVAIEQYQRQHTKTIHSTRPHINDEVSKFNQQLPLLAGFGAVCPLLGLLGTVIGIMTTFETISVQKVNDISSMADGISQALITTQAGLGIGLPLVIIHQMIRFKLKKTLNTLEYYLQQVQVALAALPR